MNNGAEQQLHYGDEKKIRDDLGEEQRRSPGAGVMRCASRTWCRSSRAQAWFSALTEANRVATQRMPPAICRDAASVGIKGQAEEHHHQQRKEEHRVDGVFRAPFDAQVLHEMGPQIAAKFTGRGSIFA